MSGYLVTSPYGPGICNSWRCFQCTEHQEESGRAIGEVRAAAASHLGATGHMVQVNHGTSELLCAVATTAEQGANL